MHTVCSLIVVLWCHEASTYLTHGNQTTVPLSVKQSWRIWVNEANKSTKRVVTHRPQKNATPYVYACRGVWLYKDMAAQFNLYRTHIIYVYTPKKLSLVHMTGSLRVKTTIRRSLVARFNVKMLSNQYRNFYCKDKTVSSPCFYNGNACTCIERRPGVATKTLGYHRQACVLAWHVYSGIYMKYPVYAKSRD